MKSDANEGRSHLKESQDRQQRFERELAIAKSAERRYLLSEWKEQIISDCIAALKATDDPKLISSLDANCAIVLDLAMSEKSG